MSRATALWALDLAVERERESNEFYLECAKKTADVKGKRMFQWLAGEESKHLKWVEQLRLALIQCKEMTKVAGLDGPLVMKADFPKLIMPSTPVKPNAKGLEALRLGIRTEKDSIILYDRAFLDTSEAEGRAIFARLGQEEQSHLDILEEQYEWLRQSGAYFTVNRFQLPRK